MANTIRNNILAYARMGMIDNNNPYATRKRAVGRNSGFHRVQ